MRFYYADGSTFEGSWEDAPAWELQAVTFCEPRGGREVMRHGGDFYYCQDGRVIPIDLMGLVQMAVRLGLIKVGSMLPHDRWDAIYQQAKEELNGRSSV